MAIALYEFGPNLFVVIIWELFQGNKKARADQKIVSSRVIEADGNMNGDWVNCRI
ncbi:MAG: hypothetical protein L6R41_005903, partial [Letrouitia leprolyta]